MELRLQVADPLVPNFVYEDQAMVDHIIERAQTRSLTFDAPRSLQLWLLISWSRRWGSRLVRFC